MSEPEKTSVRLKVDDVGKIPSMVELYLKGSNPPNLVLLQLDSKKFPRRTLDFPSDVRKYVMTHPKVKVEWDSEPSKLVDLEWGKRSSEEITVGLCTQPHRKEPMLNVIKSILP